MSRGGRLGVGGWGLGVGGWGLCILLPADGSGPLSLRARELGLLLRENVSTLVVGWGVGGTRAPLTPVPSPRSRGGGGTRPELYLAVRAPTVR